MIMERPDRSFERVSDKHVVVPHIAVSNKEIRRPSQTESDSARASLTPDLRIRTIHQRIESADVHKAKRHTKNDAPNEGFVIDYIVDFKIITEFLN